MLRISPAPPPPFRALSSAGPPGAPRCMRPFGPRQKIASYTAEDVLRLLAALLPKLSPSAFPPPEVQRLPADAFATPGPDPGGALSSPVVPSTRPLLHAPQPPRLPLSTPTFPDHMQYLPLRHGTTPVFSASPQLPPQPAPAQSHSGGLPERTECAQERQAAPPTGDSCMQHNDDFVMPARASDWKEEEARWMTGLQQAPSSHCSHRPPVSIRAPPPHAPSSPPPPAAAPPPPLQRQERNTPHHAGARGDAAAWVRAAAGLVAAQQELQDERLRAWKAAGAANSRQPCRELLRGGGEYREMVPVPGGCANSDWHPGTNGTDAVPYNGLLYDGVSRRGAARSPSPLVSVFLRFQLSLALPVCLCLRAHVHLWRRQ